jgi:hypothetical protein
MVVEEIPAQGSAFGKIAVILREGIGRAGTTATEAMDFAHPARLLCEMMVA